MAGRVIIRNNPFDPRDRAEHAHTGPLIDLLERTHPQGFGGPSVALFNAKRLPVAEYDRAVGDDDEVMILISPADPLSGAVGVALVGALVSTALSYVSSWLLGTPDAPDVVENPAGPSPVYSLSVPTNTARLGETIPVQYGKVLAVPDIISQPYRFYRNNEQYLVMLLGLGHGDHTVHKLQVAESPVSQMQAGVFQWWDYEASDHGGHIGQIQTDLAANLVFENVVTSPEVADQELEDPPAEQRYGTITGAFTATVDGGVPEVAEVGSLVLFAQDLSDFIGATITNIDIDRVTITVDADISEYMGFVGMRFYAVGGSTIGPFVACGSQQITTLLMLSVVFPRGLWYTDTTGNRVDHSVTIKFQAGPIDSAGASIGPTINREVVYTAGTSTPQRFTEFWAVPQNRYNVSAERITKKVPRATDMSDCLWVGLSAVLNFQEVGTDETVLYQFSSVTEPTESLWINQPGYAGNGQLVSGADLYGCIVAPHSTNTLFFDLDSVLPASNVVNTKYIFRQFDVSAYATEIDAQTVTASAEVWVTAVAAGDGGDVGVSFWDIDNINLPEEDYALGWRYGTRFLGGCGEWSRSSVEMLIPIGTRWIRLIQRNYIGTGTYANAYFDDAKLSINVGSTVAPVPAYLDTHVIPVKIKATNGIAADAQNRIGVSCTRQLNGSDTRNPADAFFDIYTSPSYGPGRPGNELDEEAISAFEAQWATVGETFDAVFDHRGSVWEAMKRSIRVAQAFPTIYGGLITLLEDAPQTLSTMEFSTGNIVKDSMSIGYSFDVDGTIDGYEVEYRDPTSFISKYALYPPDSVLPERVILWGCTDEDKACEHAQILWRKRWFRRKRAAFEVETEGNLPLIGDLVNIQHRLIGDGVTPEQFIIDTISPSSEFRVAVEAIPYDARVYETGECSDPWVPPPVDSVCLIDYKLDTSTETTLDAWSHENGGGNGISIPWGLSATQNCGTGSTIYPRSTNPTFISAEAAGSGRSGVGWITREFDVTEHAATIDAGGVIAQSSAWISSYEFDNDPGRLVLVCRDESLADIGRSQMDVNYGCPWQKAVADMTVPVGTRYIWLSLVCDMELASYYSTYFDDVSLKVGCA